MQSVWAGLVLLGLVLAITVRLAQLALAWRNPGLFSYIGYDFGNLWAQAWVFDSLGMARAYDVATVSQVATPVLDLARQQIGQAQGNPPLEVLPGPYPPPVILLLAPSTLLPAYWAFGVWIGVNLVALGYVSVQLSRRVAHHRILILLIPISFYPLTEALILGQPTILLMFALYQGYLSLEGRRDIRAGLWLGLLLIKPQFILALGLVLLWKRRWKAVLGLLLVGGVILVSSVGLLGPEGLKTYVSVFGMFSGFRVTFPGVLPEVGITWHALLLNVLPASIGEAEGTLLTLAMSVLTVALLPVLWRGAWDVESPAFAGRILATIVVTMLVAYHNHVHGAAMLVAPALLAFTSGAATSPLRWTLWAGLFTHPVLFVLSRAFDLPIRISLAYILLMVAALAIIVASQFGWLSPAAGPRARLHSLRPSR